MVLGNVEVQYVPRTLTGKVMGWIEGIFVVT